MVYHNRKEILTRQVEVYRQVGNTTFIASGLYLGEKVITRNQLLIYDALND
jgi:cobalt-zinc-cadmium efflux system membrane fusion protein